MRSCLELIAALKREFLSGNAPAETSVND